ncbi:MAG: sulfite exporter TauE/SafE family protein [bacterium]
MATELAASGLTALCLTAASIGFMHTLMGPDHYIPFIAMAKAGRWSLARTALVTFLCGLGHIGSSVLLGFVGIAFGLAVSRLEFLEAFRGNLAGWAFIAFGLIYMIWGVRRAVRNRPHNHLHRHGDEMPHEHGHSHAGEHVHVHAEKASMTPWILFTVFVFGPCEPLIPLVMYPAARHSFWGVVWVTVIFGAATIGTMMSVVLPSVLGVKLLPMGRLERYSHALAGFAILICGMAIQFLGL